MSDVRPFGEDPALLEEARAIASDALEVWGDFDEHQWKQFRERGIWNDHVAVQAALAALSPSNRESNAVLAKENRERVAALDHRPASTVGDVNSEDKT